MALYPDIQQKVFDEVYSVAANGIEEQLTIKQLNELKYMDLVIKEVLRLYTPVPLIARCVPEDMEISKLTQHLHYCHVPSMILSTFFFKKRRAIVKEALGF